LGATNAVTLNWNLYGLHLTGMSRHNDKDFRPLSRRRLRTYMIEVETERCGKPQRRDEGTPSTGAVFPSNHDGWIAAMEKAAEI